LIDKIMIVETMRTVLC